MKQLIGRQLTATIQAAKIFFALCREGGIEAEGSTFFVERLYGVHVLQDGKYEGDTFTFAVARAAVTWALNNEGREQKPPEQWQSNKDWTSNPATGRLYRKWSNAAKRLLDSGITLILRAGNGDLFTVTRSNSGFYILGSRPEGPGSKHIVGAIDLAHLLANTWQHGKD